MATYEPAPVPNLADKTKPQGTDLTPKQQAELDKVLAHFSNPDYKLPQVDAENSTLSDEEKFWLVCFGIAFELNRCGPDELDVTRM